MEQTSFAVAIRNLRDEDIPFAMELKNIAGWNQIESDWRRYMELEPNGCFIAEVDGRKAGTATAIRYGSEVGWIGMVLVHPDMRRYGIGTALLKRTIRYLQELGVKSIKLDATPMGKKVYVPLGFVDEYDLDRYEGVAAPALPEQKASQAAGASGSTDKVELLTVQMMEELIAYDAGHFGVSREDVLLKLVAAGLPYGTVIRRNGRIAGYLLAHEGYEAIQAGPWAADDPQIAESLFAALLVKAEGRKLLLDVPGPNQEGAALMAKYGFTVQRGFARMYLGANGRPGNPACIYATSGAEKG
jgi:GNAT superfamily N-acetyltransferase